MNKKTKHILHWAGTFFAFVGIVFVALRLQRYSKDIDFSRFTISMWLVIIALVIIYGVANILLALAWRNLLEKFGVKTRWQWSLRVYGVTQIAKYVPGNIFHLAGRQGMGMAAGLPAWSIAKASLWELGLISVAGGMLGILAGSLLLKNISEIVVYLAFFSVMLGFLFIVWRWQGTKVLRAFLYQSVFLIVSGVLFIILVEMLSQAGAELPWIPLCSAYILAWLIGLLTPGSPAGVGVRELVLLFLLNGLVSDADLLLAIVLGRIVTVSGDVMFYIMALLMKSRECNLIVKKRV